jgi:hypothetical protein
MRRLLRSVYPIHNGEYSEELRKVAGEQHLLWAVFLCLTSNEINTGINLVNAIKTPRRRFSDSRQAPTPPAPLTPSTGCLTLLPLPPPSLQLVRRLIMRLCCANSSAVFPQPTPSPALLIIRQTRSLCSHLHRPIFPLCQLVHSVTHSRCCDKEQSRYDPSLNLPAQSLHASSAVQQ